MESKHDHGSCPRKQHRIGTFNRTSMESKQMSNYVAIGVKIFATFNRTSMESKHDVGDHASMTTVSDTFNRTSMESKHL